jgi:hypothetical protein
VEFQVIEHLVERLQDVGHAALAAATAPVVPKSVVANVVEKLAIVAIGAGVALWANDQRQSDKLDQLGKTLAKQEESSQAATRRLEEKIDRIEREGSRPVVSLQSKLDAVDARLRLIEIRLERRR